MRCACDGPGWLAVACALLLACARAHAGSDTLAPGVCPSMDIRNSPDQIARLKGCRVIEGQLSIVLMERATTEIFDNITFPELREVTDYIMVYRAKGVRNLGDLFPNLTVVRGLQLFKDFAIVIFDNIHLGAIGLRSLAKIERGGVRIQHNDNLCYTNTVDWSRIIVDNVNNIIKSNYDTRLCGLCPNAQNRPEDHQLSQQSCPTDASGKMLCWDDRHCQKTCMASCGDRGCLPNGTCCNQACLGGCDGPLPSDCHVCRNFSFRYGPERTCLDSCPPGTYELFRRCVTEQECRSMPPPPPPATNSPEAVYRYSTNTRFYKTLNNTKCVFTCPSGFMEVGEDIRNSTCQPCPSSGCVRECAGGKIDSVAAAEQFRGCTHVKGKLEITIRASGGNTLSVLESSLGEVREIHGCLQVTRAYPLVSLMFLRKLRKIIGVPSSDCKGQVLHVSLNQNLELLWDWAKHDPLQISGGSLSIRSNPKLCYNQLLPLANMISNHSSEFTELEVSRENNGYQAYCTTSVLHLKVSELSRTVVVLTWNAYCTDDVRPLLGYSLYYIPAPHNVTLYDQRDACSDIWNVLDITIDEARNGSRDSQQMARTESSKSKNKTKVIFPACNKQPSFYPISQLIPYTRYAAYVKTYTTLQDMNGAQSSIIYFRTLPGAPSPPMSLTVDLLSPHSIYIQWSPPTMANGTIVRYEVEVQANSYNIPKILAINYCNNPGALANLNRPSVEDAPETQEKATTGDVKNESCTCKEEESKPSTKFNLRAEEERMDSIIFENELQNQVYKKNDRPKGKTGANIRIKRSTEHSVNSMLVQPSEINKPLPGRKYTNTTDSDEYVKSQHYELDGKTLSLTVKNLRHFTWYTVNVWACRNKHENETQEFYAENWCSDRAYYTFRTLELPNSDVVTSVQAELMPSNKTFAEVNVTWTPPVNPNGFVVAYKVLYSRVDDTNQDQDLDLQSCFTVDDYDSENHGHIRRIQSPGNYSIKVTPVTVNGAGNASTDVFVYIPERLTDSGSEWIWGLVGGLIIMLLVLGVGIWYARRGLLSPTEASKLYASVNPEYVSTVYVPDEWEVPRGNIEFIRELGQGSFGMVYEGIAKSIEKGKPETRCAVKTVNEHATDRERIEFLNEASVMKAFDTFHVVRLLGVVSRGQPTLVVMELMECGDLKSYLRSHRPDADSSLPKKDNISTPPSLHNILQMAIEIADGMAYLSAKKFVHRDLAARNCMVAGDLTVKVGDFGMTRDIYETDYYRKGTRGLLPVRWMSPESLKDGVFSSSSDVWSYGVVLWEMATLAMQPYQGLSNEQVVRYVVEGGVMERPEHCPDRLYELMRACWAHRPPARPSFLRLVADLAPHAQPYFRHRSFFHTPQGQETYALHRTAADEEQELPEVNVGAVATGSGSNLFGVSGRLASWVRELSSLRSRASEDAAAEPLQPLRAPTLQPLQPLKGPNGVLRGDCDHAHACDDP